MYQSDLSHLFGLMFPKNYIKWLLWYQCCQKDFSDLLYWYTTMSINLIDLIYLIFLMVSLSNLRLSIIPYASFCLLKRRIMRLSKKIHAKNSHSIYFQISFFNFSVAFFFFPPLSISFLFFTFFLTASEVRGHSILPHWCL